MFSDTEIIAFNGTFQSLMDQFELIRATMPKSPAFVQDNDGKIFNRIRVKVNKLTDGSHTWDLELYRAF